VYTQNEILSLLRSAKPHLEKKYGVKTLALFGSYSRNTAVNGKSDIDVMVDFSEPIGLVFVALADELETLLQLLAHPTVEGALKVADKLQKVPLSGPVSCLQRWLYDVFSYKLAGNIRYYPRYQKELASLADKVHVSRLLTAIKSANERRATADHPLSPKLFLEDMLLDYAHCCA